MGAKGGNKLRRFGATLLCLLLASMAAVAGASERRVALVIGNAAYREAPLRNPVNDARAIATALRNAGFEVLLHENVNRARFPEVVGQFGERLSEGATGLFYFAGHGLQVQGRNYLVPVDAAITSEQRVRLEAMDVEAVLDQMHAARTRVSMVILDACRNNPFERRFRSTSGGLAQMNAPTGTLVAYATAPGRVAADGLGSHGVYTEELLKAMTEPGLKVEDVFKQVRVNVMRATGEAQIPWESSSLTGDFVFVPPRPATPRPSPPAATTPPPAATVLGPPSVDRSALDLAFWQSISESENKADYEAYLERFPNGTFAPLARNRVATLGAPTRTQAPTPQSAAPVLQSALPVPQSAAPAPRPAEPPPPNVAALPSEKLQPFRIEDVQGDWRGQSGRANVNLNLTISGSRVSGRLECQSAPFLVQGRIAADGTVDAQAHQQYVHLAVGGRFPNLNVYIVAGATVGARCGVEDLVMRRDR
ncbi:MAG: caspase family protein [Alphaproteobacteria bacterium]|nr:caspase family protein [Alphaproteobacteria bacterium]